jgi:voltage-gated potassium channel
MFVMVIVITFAATGIYIIERDANPDAFDSIPKAMWWAAVTLTTVGYGDVVPSTVLGKAFGLVITIAGVGMVALPAGILASGFSSELQRRRERYRLEVKRAIADGTLSSSETRTLEAAREMLGLTTHDAEVIRAERASPGSDPFVCPHCGGPIGKPEPGD